MRFRSILTGIVSSTLPALFAALLVLAAPGAGAGQWIPTRPEIAALQALPDATALQGEAATFPILVPALRTNAAPLAAVILTPDAQVTPRLLEEDKLKIRVARYGLAGLVAGGLLGYMAYEGVFWDRAPCDGDYNLLCPLTPYVYVLSAAGVGFWTGSIIGYLRERR